MPHPESTTKIKPNVKTQPENWLECLPIMFSVWKLHNLLEGKKRSSELIVEDSTCQITSYMYENPSRGHCVLSWLFVCSVWSGFEQLSSRQLHPSSRPRSDLAAVHTWSQTAALHPGIFHFLFSLTASPLTLHPPPQKPHAQVSFHKWATSDINIAHTHTSTNMLDCHWAKPYSI